MIDEKIKAEVLMFVHQCEHRFHKIKKLNGVNCEYFVSCGERWNSSEKADHCPKCGHWHIAMSSFLQTVENEVENVQK